MRMRSAVLTLALPSLACLLIHATPAGAVSRSSTFSIALVLQNDCRIQTNDLDFGSSGMIAANIDTTTTLSVTCTPGTAYNIGLNEGSTIGSTVLNRLLGITGSPFTPVAFQLFQDSARQSVWGNTPGIDTLDGIGNGLPEIKKVYGRVPIPVLPPAAGAYTSTIMATVTF